MKASGISGKRKNPDPLPVPSKIKRTTQRTTRISSSQPTCSTKRDKTFDDQMSVSADDHVTDDAICPVCKQTTISDGVEVKSLRCCICRDSYHGDCLSIEDSLKQYLHVVVDIGGWCCVHCRTSKKIIYRKSTKESIAAPPLPIIDEFRKDLEVIKTQITSLSDHLLAYPPLPKPAAPGQSILSMGSGGLRDLRLTSAPGKGGISAKVVVAPKVVTGINNRKPNSSSETSPASVDFRSAVLTAVHSEFRTMNKRSSNVVVSGLKPSKDDSDDDLFKDLCMTHFSIYLTIVKTCRLGKPIPGKIQPLLVTLPTQAEANHLISLSKTLRSVNDPHVKAHVFINKHLTAAESKAAYDARISRRAKTNRVSDPLRPSSIVPQSSSSISIPQDVARAADLDATVLTIHNDVTE